MRRTHCVFGLAALVAFVAIAAGCDGGEVVSGDARADRGGSGSDTIEPNDSGEGSDSGVGTDVAFDATVEDAEMTPDLLPDGSPPSMDAAAPPLGAGVMARVTATALNLRSGPGTTNMILTSMPCGTLVTIVGGPTSGWWNVRYMAMTGWASGAYLVADSAFDPAICMMSTPDAGTADTGGAPMPAELASMFSRARCAVGYSYYWGHGSWTCDATMYGTCSGSCPSCTHTGRYGADCSGFVAKVWQIPSASAITTDLHPYSTYDFVNSNTHWSRVPRAMTQTADALVYNVSGSGHMMLFESGSDPWGNIWTFEARGCSYGIVHNLRVAGSMFVAIRREGL